MSFYSLKSFLCGTLICSLKLKKMTILSSSTELENNIKINIIDNKKKEDLFPIYLFEMI